MRIFVYCLFMVWENWLDSILFYILFLILDNNILKLLQLDLPSPFLQRERMNFLKILIKVQGWKYFKRGGGGGDMQNGGDHTPLPTIWYLIVSIYLSFSAMLSGWGLHVWSIQWEGNHTEITWFGIHLTTLCKTNPPKLISRRITRLEIDESK